MTEAYRLTPAALNDLEDIWRYTAEQWSVGQAERYIDQLARVFDLLAAMPDMAREYLEFSPPVRIHVHERHLIIYVRSENGVMIIRILGARQDWREILKKLDS